MALQQQLETVERERDELEKECSQLKEQLAGQTYEPAANLMAVLAEAKTVVLKKMRPKKQGESKERFEEVVDRVIEVVREKWSEGCDAE